MSRRALITGGAGFLGFHLAKTLAVQEIQVTVVDNWFRTQRPDQGFTDLCASQNVRFIQMDVTDQEAWDRLEGPYDEIYHFAAVNGTRYFYDIPHEVLRINLLGVLHLVRWLGQRPFGGKVLFASSSEIYAGLEQVAAVPIPTPETVPSAFADVANPRISYGVSKLAGELCLRHCGRANGWRWVIVRYHNVYGPRMGREHVIPTLCGRLLRREDPVVLFGASNRRAFCYIDDAITATRLVMESPRTDGEVINIGDDREELSIEALAKRLIRHAGYQPRIEVSDAPEGSAVRRCPDVSKLHRLTGFAPHVGLDEGLGITYEWYSHNAVREPLMTDRIVR